jgi:hypothetical protein
VLTFEGRLLQGKNEVIVVKLKLPFSDAEVPRVFHKHSKHFIGARIADRGATTSKVFLIVRTCPGSCEQVILDGCLIGNALLEGSLE